jgi:predicted transcriptional regulator
MSNWPQSRNFDKIQTFGDRQAIFVAQATLKENSTPSVPGAQPEDFETLLKEAQRLASRRVAGLARKIMSSWLSPDGEHSVGIGWRGTAAKNLYVGKTALTARGGFMYAVREKLNTHNEIIRRGLRPGETGKHVSIEDFEKWVADRGVEYEGRERTDRDTAMRIFRSIRKSGTSDWWPDHVQAVEGRRYFNYPQKYLDDHARNDTEYVIRRMTQGSRGLQADITSVVMGSLSSARVREKINTKTYYAGDTGRRGLKRGRKGWQMYADATDLDDYGDEW